MKYVEFIVFLSRLAFQHYKDTPYHMELMYIKIDKMLPRFLAPLNLTPMFSFNDEFEYKPAVKKKKPPKQKIIRVESDASSAVSESDDSSSDESSEEDMADLIQLEPGKYTVTEACMTRLTIER